jgi:hypothetical protein
MSDERIPEEDAFARDESETPPTAREAQRPIGPVDADGTWLSGEDEVDPQREEAAERASRAVKPGRPRE